MCSNLEVYLNGQLVHSGGRMSEPVTRNCNHPQLVSLPAALLRAEGNMLDIKVAGYALQQVASRQRAGGLSALHDRAACASCADATRASTRCNVARAAGA